MKEFDNVWALCEEVSKMVDTFVRNNMTNTNAENLGLDSRAGYSLFVDDNCIAVHKSNDSKLQYYGGFEYIDAECRKDLGDWVFYLSDDERVSDCIEFFSEAEV